MSTDWVINTGDEPTGVNGGLLPATARPEGRATA